MLVLTNLGEKMTDDEVDELLKAVDTSSGEVNYTGTFSFSDFRLKGERGVKADQAFLWGTDLVRTILAN